MSTMKNQLIVFVVTFAMVPCFSKDSDSSDGMYTDQAGTAALETQTWPQDYEIESWRCGAPLVQELIKAKKLVLVPSANAGGLHQLISSLRKLSESNMAELLLRLGHLSPKEQQLLDLVTTFYHAPVVHRTNIGVARSLLTTSAELSSPIKSGVKPFTPVIEQELFSGHDCIFTSIGVPEGTERYGTVAMRLKERAIFGWATLRSGFQWVKNDLKQDPNGPADSSMRLNFAKHVFTDESWDAVLGLNIIEYIREGKTFLNQGKSYNNKTMLAHLLGQKDSNAFWGKIQKYRLGYMEGKHVTNISAVGSIDSIQFQLIDEPVVKTWQITSPDLSSLVTFYSNNQMNVW